MYYGVGRSRAWCIGVMLVLWGTLEAALVFALRSPICRPRPQYYETYKHGAVIGSCSHSWPIDLLGGVFSILSLVFKRQVDTLAAVTYALVVVRHRTTLYRVIFLVDGAFAWGAAM
ncbi:hypothetical protein F5148DRAFT_1175922 [Russula earlei]|uniref:Uncharacterized protein n=1 Tax=Russula earlei TaxID=71964 RepID=A0ACC0UHL5_9AGAM|nr:hypothetical protein F5148DRAFT_1175922 [Russula earlei]